MIYKIIRYLWIKFKNILVKENERMLAYIYKQFTNTLEASCIAAAFSQFFVRIEFLRFRHFRKSNWFGISRTSLPNTE